MPPPIIVLGTKLNVSSDYDGLGDGDGEKRRDNAEESKDVVI